MPSVTRRSRGHRERREEIDERVLDTTADLLSDRRHRVDISVGRVALAEEPERLRRDERARAVIESARRDPVVGEHQDRLLDHGEVADADARGRRRGVVRADVNEEALDARRLIAGEQR